eukprot:14801234-Alexandrium_andersonii.AAC.1
MCIRDRPPAPSCGGAPTQFGCRSSGGQGPAGHHQGHCSASAGHGSSVERADGQAGGHAQNAHAQS